MQIKKKIKKFNLSFSLLLVFIQLFLFSILFVWINNSFLFVFGYLCLALSLLIQFYLVYFYFVKRITLLTEHIDHKDIVDKKKVVHDAIDSLIQKINAYETYSIQKEQASKENVSFLERDNQRLKQFAYIVADVMRQIKDGNLAARLSEPQEVDEIGKLQGGINSMLEEIQKRTLQRDDVAKKLQKYTEILEQRNEELKQFAYVASHDLQEPLRKIVSFGDCLKDLCEDSLDDQGKDYLFRMHAATYRMQKLIASLLNYSRVTSHEHDFKSVCLSDIIKEVMSDLEIMIGSVWARIEFDELPTIQADAMLMRQLFQNLIANAIKFCDYNTQPHIQITVEEKHSNYIEIFIKDNGVGFDEKYLNKIFQPFQRLHTRDEFEGTGMGLAICYKIVSIHEGSITAESKIGEGSTFKIRLPKQL